MIGCLNHGEQSEEITPELIEQLQEILDKRRQRKEQLKREEEERINALFDSCAFDDIVEGYLIAVLDEMEIPKEKIVEAVEKLRFDFTYLGANEIRAIRKGFMESIEKDALTAN